MTKLAYSICDNLYVLLYKYHFNSIIISNIFKYIRYNIKKKKSLLFLPEPRIEEPRNQYRRI